VKTLLLPRRDIDFLLFEWLRVDELTRRERFADHSTESFGDVLTLCEQLAKQCFAPHNKLADVDEPVFDGTNVTVLPEVKDAFGAFSATGLLGMTLDEKHGGAQFPVVVATAAYLWLQAANFSTISYSLLSLANANLLASFGSAEQTATFLSPILSGRYTGTMCLSEPHAGSSLADITTRAEPENSSAYRLFGSKMWISAGDHDMTENIVHLVLAKLPDAPAGTKGISLFIVPKHLVNADGSIGERNDVVTAGLNHKMGQRGMTNALLNFGDGAFRPGGRAGAVGYLVGQPHHGLAYMFHMMNEARLMTGAGATALGYTAHLKSLEYARTRTQGRPITSKDPATPPVPIIEHPDVKRMLLAQKSYVEGALALVLYCSRLTDIASSAESRDEADSATLLLDLLTPVAKSWPSQWCLEANDLAIQLHGGYGYTRDYDVEQHYRDNRINAIHEGTHGIQSLDLLARKVRQRDGAGLRLLAGEISRTIAEADLLGGEPEQLARQLDSAWRRLSDTTATLLSWDELDVTLANSAIYLEAFGHIVIAWIWLEQVIAAADKDGSFYDGKRYAARYYYRYELPKTASQLDLLQSLDRTTLEAVL